MTRIKRFFGVILMSLFLCVCFLFGGCAKKEFEGTYKFSKMLYTEGGVQIEIEAGEKFMGMMTLTEDFVKLSLNEDGTASMIMLEDGETDMSLGTWIKVDDETIAITFDGDTQNCECDGENLTIESDGAKIILKK